MKNSDFIINNVSISSRKFSEFAYKITLCRFPYFVIVSDSNDGNTSVYLLKNNKEKSELVSKMRLPINAKKITLDIILSSFVSCIVQNYKKTGNYGEEYLKYYMSLFNQNDKLNKLYMELHELLIQNKKLVLPKISGIFAKAYEVCGLNFELYSKVFSSSKKSMYKNIYNQMYMQWIFLADSISLFISNSINSKELSSIQMYFLGDIQNVLLLSDTKIPYNKKLISYNAGTDKLFFNNAVKIFEKNTNNNDLKLYLSAINYPFESEVTKNCLIEIDTEDNLIKPENSEIDIFNQELTGFSEDINIYVNNKNKTPILPDKSSYYSFDGRVKYLMPFSKEFSILLSSEKAVIKNIMWNKLKEGIGITVEFDYNGRTYKPEQKIYKSKNITTDCAFPKIFVSFSKKELRYYFEQNEGPVSAKLYNALHEDVRTYIEHPIKTLIFGIFMENGDFIGNVRYSF